MKSTVESTSTFSFYPVYVELNGEKIKVASVPAYNMFDAVAGAEVTLEDTPFRDSFFVESK